uniref:Uncharacterized protein n=1 Tax=Prolemur simus TaxID=1328070 RepID=A0A8C9AII3_PROSS
ALSTSMWLRYHHYHPSTELFSSCKTNTLLGVLWSYLLLTQFIALHKEYFPLVAITGYSFWSSWSFTFSGIFTTVVEKSSSISLMSYTIYLNISSACIAMIGLLLLSFEFAIFSLNTKTIMWPHVSTRFM